jgi:hypothetical protein
MRIVFGISHDVLTKGFKVRLNQGYRSDQVLRQRTNSDGLPDDPHAECASGTGYETPLPQTSAETPRRETFQDDSGD